MASGSGAPKMIGLRRSSSARVKGSERPSYLPPISKNATVRRGTTPTRAGESFGLPSNPKYKFTLEESIQIFERLETGDYVKGEGIRQFIPEDANPFQCKQNLAKEFAKLSVSDTRIEKPGPSFDAKPGTSKSATTTKPCDQPDLLKLRESFMEVEEGYSDFPKHLKVADQFIVTLHMFLKTREKLSKAKASSLFASILPPRKLVEQMQLIKKITMTLARFNRKCDYKKTLMFMPQAQDWSKAKPKSKPQMGNPTENATNYFLSCDAREQRKLMEAFHRGSAALNKLNEILSRTDAIEAFILRAKNLMKVVNSYENRLGSLDEQQTIQTKKVIKKINRIQTFERVEFGTENDEVRFDSSSSSSGIVLTGSDESP